MWQSDTRPRQLSVGFPQLSRFLFCSFRDGAFSLNTSLNQNFSPKWWGNSDADGDAVASESAEPWSHPVRLWAPGKGGGEESREGGGRRSPALSIPPRLRAPLGAEQPEELCASAGSAQGERAEGRAAEPRRAEREPERGTAPGEPALAAEQSPARDGTRSGAP